MIQTATNQVTIPEGSELIDDVFYVWETRYGLFSSMTKDCLLYTSDADDE